MDRANLRGEVAFRTDIDRQQVLPFGSPTEVQEEVHRTFEACGSPDGGIIACGEIGPDVPLDNIRAMYAAFREYGVYEATSKLQFPVLPDQVVPKTVMRLFFYQFKAILFINFSGFHQNIVCPQDQFLIT